MIRGKGCPSQEVEALEYDKACDQFDAQRKQYLVVENNALEDEFGSPSTFRIFYGKKDALKYARSQSNGNVDHRVIELGAQTMVVGTDNEL